MSWTARCSASTALRPPRAARILGARRIVPVHFDSWADFTEGREQLVDTFTTDGLIDRVELA